MRYLYKKKLIFIPLIVFLLLMGFSPAMSQPTNVAIFKDVDPWDEATNELLLTSLAIPYTVYTSANIGVVDLSAYDKVIIPSDQTDAFYAVVEANRSYFEDYVAAGGVLHLHATDGGWHGGYWPTGALPCGYQYEHRYGELVDVLIPNHPVLNNPHVITDPELDNWNYSYHGGVVSGFPVGTEIVLHDTLLKAPVLVISNYGSGSVIVTTMTIEWATKNNITYLLENTMLYDAGTYGPGNVNQVFGNNTSPMAIYMPLVRTNLSIANDGWSCLLENLPEEVPEDIATILGEVSMHMENAQSLSNPIGTNGELIKAINLMKQISSELELGCFNS